VQNTRILVQVFLNSKTGFGKTYLVFHLPSMFSDSGQRLGSVNRVAFISGDHVVIQLAATNPCV
jgi:hypothetical protein